MLGLLLTFVLSLTAPVASSHVAQTIRGVDLDGDGRSDAIELSCSQPGYCGSEYFDTIRFDLSASGTRSFQSQEGWVEFDPPSAKPAELIVDAKAFPQPNLLHSRYAYAHTFPIAGTLAFFLGAPPGGSTFNGATIFAITKNGVSKYFEPEEFLFHNFIRPTGDDKRWRMVVGTATAEAFTDENFPGAEIRTYCPATVFVLGSKVSIDKVRTEKLARKKYGGYAGPLPRSDVMAVSLPDPPRRFLVTWPGKKRIK